MQMAHTILMLHTMMESDYLMDWKTMGKELYRHKFVLQITDPRAMTCECNSNNVHTRTFTQQKYNCTSRYNSESI